MDVPDLKSTPPPPDWGVTIDADALEALADRWVDKAFVLPAFDYAGTPQVRDEAWWFDYVTMAVSVLACLWPPEGDDVWHADLGAEWLDDAPGIFAVFTRALERDGLELDRFAEMTDAEGSALFAGRGTLQLVAERVDLLRDVAGVLLSEWGGSAANLVAAADRDGGRIANLLTDTIPGFRDRPISAVGELRFDKLSHLAAAIMAAGVGWSDGGFGGFDNFPVYPDYMLPRVFRTYGVMIYDTGLAATVDSRRILAADSPAEHAIRWATIYCGAELTRALQSRDVVVSPPALDYRLWSTAVLGPDAALFGEHHRTVTLRY